MSVSTISTPSVTRRFEFVGGNSAKFWQVTVAGTKVTVRFGRLGTDGQVQTKEFPSAEAASGHAERLIAQKSAKGYQEVRAV
jgi:predicted DNA-binding WGR domain protein